MPKSATELQENVRQILKTWNKPNFSSEPLHHLHLYQQRLRRGTTSAQQITRNILLDALHTLANENKEAYEIIERHYLKDQKIANIARSINLAEGTVYNYKQCINSTTNFV